MFKTMVDINPWSYRIPAHHRMRFDYQALMEPNSMVMIKVSKGIVLDARWVSPDPPIHIDEMVQTLIGHLWNTESTLLGVAFEPCPPPQWIPLPS